MSDVSRRAAGRLGQIAPKGYAWGQRIDKGWDQLKRIATELMAQLVVLAVLAAVMAVGAGFFGATTGATAFAVERSRSIRTSRETRRSGGVSDVFGNTWPRFPAFVT